ncbi:MAG: hypothetical protein LBU83_05200 [Bacteroidales bacterium]|jgi:hypothetical protein|nr:hypothetical protein [Bacteroidales bacterium]
MKKQLIVFMLTIAVITIVFVSCEKEKISRNIVAENVQNSNDAIDFVEAFILSDKDLPPLADADYDDHSFKLTLPKSVSDEYLEGEKNGKTGMLVLVAFDENENEMGNFFWFDNNKKIQASYVYANKEVVAKGKLDTSPPQTWDCSFSKGWNIIYAEAKGDETYVSSKKPSNLSLLWYFKPKNTQQTNINSYINSEHLIDLMKNLSKM